MDQTLTDLVAVLDALANQDYDHARTCLDNLRAHHRDAKGQDTATPRLVDGSPARNQDYVPPQGPYAGYDGPQGPQHTGGLPTREHAPGYTGPQGPQHEGSYPVERAPGE